MKYMTVDKAPFTTGDLVVYPTHGVGKIVAIENQEIAGHTLNVFVVHFDKDRMTLRVPLAKAKVSGLRKLSSRKEMDAALLKLRVRSRAKRTMWSRRAQEYQAKIASGDPGPIAEVVRDLHRNTGQPEQSYSERQIYQAALDRLVREFAAVERSDESTATRRVEQMLTACSRCGRAAARERGVNGAGSNGKFARLGRARRIWAVAAIHGEAARLARVHDFIGARFREGDRLVYLGNYFGHGEAVAATIDELLDFRRRILALPRVFACDVVFLRGAQEEMWQKLLQLQFAANPGEVLSWMVNAGIEPTLRAYGGELRQ